MRLDKYLLSKNFFSTRQKAKEAVRMGHVFVDGERALKPSMEINPSAEVKVISDERPKGYWKLKKIDGEANLIEENDVVLDIGSSSGGFLMYASEKASKVYGIEFSRDFEEILRNIEQERKNVKIFFGDVFKFDSGIEKVDVILNDLTLDSDSSFKALSGVLPALKDEGRVLFVLKTGIEDKEPDFGSVGLEIQNKINSEDKKERYYILRKFR